MHMQLLLLCTKYWTRLHKQLAIRLVFSLSQYMIKNIQSIANNILSFLYLHHFWQLNGGRGSIFHETYNILPLGNNGVQPPIMQYPEVCSCLIIL